MSSANGFSALPDLEFIKVSEEHAAAFSLPQEALDFEPDELTLISKFSGGDQERKIHCNMELRPDEIAQLKALQEEARRLDRSYYTSITVMATRYISYARGNPQKAIAMMDETQAWRTEYFGKGPLDSAQLLEDMSHGILYFTGRDYAMRPILVIRAERLPDAWHKDGTGVTRLIRMLVFCMEYLIRYMFIPGKIENIVVLVDLKNLGLADVPLKALKNIYSVLSHHYIVRVFKFYIVNMSYMLSTLVGVVKPILTDRQRQKLNFLKDINECKSWVSLHQLEEDLGGTRPKITTFLPFPLLPGPFEGGSTAGARKDAVPNCHKVFTEGGFRGRVWDESKTKEKNLEYEYTDAAEDIFNACGLKIPANCPVKAKEVGEAGNGATGMKKVVSLDDPENPWDVIEEKSSLVVQAPSLPMISDISAGIGARASFGTQSTQSSGVSGMPAEVRLGSMVTQRGSEFAVDGEDSQAPADSRNPTGSMVVQRGSDFASGTSRQSTNSEQQVEARGPLNSMYTQRGSEVAGQRGSEVQPMPSRPSEAGVNSMAVSVGSFDTGRDSTITEGTSSTAPMTAAGTSGTSSMAVNRGSVEYQGTSSMAVNRGSETQKKSCSCGCTLM